MTSRGADVRSLRAWLGTLALSSVLVAGAASATSGQVFGIGPRTLALSGAGATQPNGYEAAFANPAALAGQTAPDLELGYATTRFSLSLTPQASTPVADGSGGALLGFVLPLRVSSQALVFGFAARGQANRIATARLPYPETPQFPLLVQRTEATDFALSLGLRPVPVLELGVGLRGLAALNGTVSVSQNPDGTSTSNVTSTLRPALAPLLGANARLSGDDTLGLVFRGALRSDFAVEVAAVSLGATMLPPLHIAGVAHYDPLTVYAEYRRQLGPWSVLAGLAYQRWSDYPGLLAQTVQCPASLAQCKAAPAPSFALQDTWAPHVAATWQLDLTEHVTATARASYAYEPTPAPNQTSVGNELDTARHVFGLGYGVALAAPLLPLHTDFACQLQELATRRQQKDPSVPHDNPGWPAITAGGFVESCALSAGVRFR